MEGFESSDVTHRASAQPSGPYLPGFGQFWPNNRVPNLNALDAEGMKNALPHVALFEISEFYATRIRMAGHRLYEADASALGVLIGTFFDSESVARLSECLYAIKDRKAAVWLTVQVNQNMIAQEKTAQIGLLPVTTTDHDVDRILFYDLSHRLLLDENAPLTITGSQLVKPHQKIRSHLRLVVDNT